MGRDWRWLTRYTPRTPEGREQILRGLAGEGGSGVAMVVLFAIGGPVLRSATAGMAWWPRRAAIEATAFLALVALGLGVGHAARWQLRRRSRRPVAPS